MLPLIPVEEDQQSVDSLDLSAPSPINPTIEGSSTTRKYMSVGRIDL